MYDLKDLAHSYLVAERQCEIGARLVACAAHPLLTYYFNFDTLVCNNFDLLAIPPYELVPGSQLNLITPFLILPNSV